MYRTIYIVAYTARDNGRTWGMAAAAAGFSLSTDATRIHQRAADL